MPSCPLCHTTAGPYSEDAWRAYYRCACCGLVFADPASHLSSDEEKRIYDLHENEPGDANYRRFLDRLAQPLLARLTPGMSGLDFGSGPGPTLSVMLGEAGMNMALFDPYYAPNRGVLDRTYDFVTCSEVVEHFRAPSLEWRRLVHLVRPGGWLGIMTKPVVSRDHFATWHYKRDLTHVSFYSAETWTWLAHHYQLTFEHLPRMSCCSRKGRPRIFLPIIN
jgi:hypothetical protein